MPRFFLGSVALGILLLPVQAEPTITSAEMIIRLNVQAKAAPKPALKYLLLPELKDMQPGNPIANYLKCIVDHEASEQEVFDRTCLRQADWAARLDKPDWQILHKAKIDGISLLLPDVQKIRALAAALQERFRDENARLRFDESMRTAQTMFAMSRHMSEHPTLIGDLVGIAIAMVAIAPLEEMLELSDCPNLYWALTDLPTPFLSLDKGLQGERLLIDAEFGELNGQDVLSNKQLLAVIRRIDKLREYEKSELKTQTWLNKRNKDEAYLRSARERLAESGLSEAYLQRYPADQILLLDEKLKHQIRRDDAMKLMKLPTWQVEALYFPEKKPKDEGLFEFLTPSLVRIRRAQGRLDQRLALLRHVEAVRMYAAAHEGKLPTKLADCPVPLPPDPFTGKPFRYEVVGEVAHLRGTAPKGEEKTPAYNLHYQITIRK